MFGPAHPDDQFDTYTIGTWGQTVRTFQICTHGRVIPVTSVAGEVVAHLCLTCDTQLP